MKYHRALCVLLVLCLLCASVAFRPAYAAPSDLDDNAIAEIRSEVDLQYYPFIYTEDSGFDLFRSLIGDCSQCVPGYLYVQDWQTSEIWQVLDEPVNMIRMDGDTLYCVVSGNKIIRTDYFGEANEELYHSVYGELSYLEYFEDALTFSDGGNIIRLDLTNSTWEELLFCDDLTYLFPITSNKIAWSSN